MHYVNTQCAHTHTHTHTQTHFPSYVKDYEQLKAKGVEVIACVAVNDAFVMGAWGDSQNAVGKVRRIFHL